MMMIIRQARKADVLTTTPRDRKFDLQLLSSATRTLIVWAGPSLTHTQHTQARHTSLK